MRRLGPRRSPLFVQIESGAPPALPGAVVSPAEAASPDVRLVGTTDPEPSRVRPGGRGPWAGMQGGAGVLPARPSLQGFIEEDEPPNRPGRFGTEANKVPSRFLKRNVIAPRVTPDVELLIRDRTTIGLFGEVGPAKPGIANPGWRDREVEAGLTFQYRFGTK